MYVRCSIKMKLRMLFTLVSVSILTGCGQGKTTDTLSSEFMTLAERQEFLERYVMFRRSYEDLHFDLSYIDGASGMLPAPTEWDIRVFAIVPAGEMEQWIDGLSIASAPQFDWVLDIPNAPTDISSYTWYEGDRVIVGIDQENQSVLYWNRAN